MASVSKHPLGIGSSSPTKWWITRAGDTMAVPDGEGFLDAVDRNPRYFGIEPNEVSFAKEKGENGRLALIDKLCWDIEADDGSVQIPGAIMIELGKDGLEIGFWQESYPAYERIIGWLSAQHFLPNTQVILREVGSTRAWRTNVNQLLRNPYAKNPDRRGNCPRCGQQISWDEIVERGVCPKCNEKMT